MAKKGRINICAAILFWNLCWTSVLAQTSTKSLLQQANIYYESGNFKTLKISANAAYQQWHQGDKNDTLELIQIYYWKGRTESLYQKRREALAFLDTARVLAKEKDHHWQQVIELQMAMLNNTETTLLAAIDYFKTTNNAVYWLPEIHVALGATYLTQRNYPKALQHLDLAQEAYLAAPTQTSKTGKARMLQLRGYSVWQGEKNYMAALDWFRLSEEAYLQNGGTENDFLAVLYVNMGAVYNEIGNPRQSLTVYQKAEKIFQRQDKAHPFLTQLSNNMGNSYGDIGDFTLSIRYYENAIQLANPNAKGRYWNNLGDVHLKRADYRAATLCFDSALVYLHNMAKPDSVELARPYHNLGVIARHEGRFKDALAQENRSLPFRKANPRARLDIGRTYLGIGECLLALENYDAALAVIDTAIWYQTKAVPSGILDEIAQAYMAKTQYFTHKKDYFTANQYADSALVASGYQAGGGFESVVSPMSLINALALKADVWYEMYQTTKDDMTLRKAAAWSDTAAMAIRFNRNLLIDAESKTALADLFNTVLRRGADIAYDYFKADPSDENRMVRLFLLAEQSKSMTLMEGLLHANPEAYSGMDTKLLAQEKALGQAVAEAETWVRRLQERGLRQQDQELVHARQSLFEKQRDQAQFIRQLANGAGANYYHLKYGFDFVTPTALQQTLLDNDQSMVAYFTTEKGHLLAFVLNKTDTKIITCGQNARLQEEIAIFREGVSGYYTAAPSKRTDEYYEKTLNAYIQYGQSLYQQLLAPLESHLKDKVIIVPDGSLGLIPFELLLTSPPVNPDVPGQYPYWFSSQSKEVFYAYSATLWQEMVRKKHLQPPSKTLLGMAPFYPGSAQDIQSGTAPKPTGSVLLSGKKFKPLLYSGAEVSTLADMMGGAYYAGQSATRAQFLQDAGLYRIIHLSTHGIVDTVAAFSGLGFSDQAVGEKTAIYVIDLYNTTLNADLVTLSACETGIGQIRPGEGIISIARAFAYAGAKSIVTSLWQVDDAATQSMMRSFYEYLKAGDTKSAALKKAKLRFLAQNKGEKAHPFFWGAFIGTGDMRGL